MATSAATTPRCWTTSYRLLRTLEHRIQLYRLRRTHLMPTDEADLRRLGRAVGHRRDAAREVVAQWQAQAREVRRIHERLFYRPLLTAAARLSTSEARLTPEAARERLAALGFRDPAGALRHIEALTTGVSRRAAIQRTLLPVMLGWFADEADPDAGLLSFRTISESLGTTHWYLKMLRDEGSAAERLAHVLARSRYAADLLVRAPESVAILGDAGGLSPRPRTALQATMTAATRRKESADDAMTAARVVRRQELFRVAVADLTGVLDLTAVGCALTDLTAATLQSALDIAVRRVEDDRGPLGTRLLVVGMGRLGGAEMGYASDADVLFVHQPEPGSDEGEAQKAATLVVQEMRRLLGAAGPDPQLGLDADLRPEGKSGPLVRSLQSYRRLLRAVVPGLGVAGPAAGHAGRGRRGAGPGVPGPDRPAAVAGGRPEPARRARDPHAEGPDGVRAAAPRRRPQDPLQARGRRPVRRRVDRAAAADAARASRCRRCAPPRPWAVWRRRGRRVCSRTPTPRPSARRGGWRRGCATPPCCGGDGPWTPCPATCATPTASDGSSAVSPGPGPRWPRTTAGWRDAPDLLSCPTSTKASETGNVSAVDSQGADRGTRHGYAVVRPAVPDALLRRHLRQQRAVGVG